MWEHFFDKIFVINLPKRIDRKEKTLELLIEYDIGVYFYDAIEHEKGAIGLVQTMQKLFKECLEKGYKNVLVFEDDIDFLVSKEKFHEVMNKCVSQLPYYYDLIYLGCNPSNGIKKMPTENLITLFGAYATHAVGYSKNAMEYVVSNEINEPIDNFLVKRFQQHRHIYCTYPMLVSQRVDYSDINKQRTDWKNVLEGRYNKVLDAFIKYKR